MQQTMRWRQPNFKKKPQQVATSATLAGERAVKTGDQVKIHEDGTIEVGGRRDQHARASA
jgi:non-ribosomal peptide synthetase component E (peptide arylation enzyme)